MTLGVLCACQSSFHHLHHFILSSFASFHLSFPWRLAYSFRQCGHRVALCLKETVLSDGQNRRKAQRCFSRGEAVLLSPRSVISCHQGRFSRVSGAISTLFATTICPVSLPPAALFLHKYHESFTLAPACDCKAPTVHVVSSWHRRAIPLRRPCKGLNTLCRTCSHKPPSQRG